MIRKITGGSSYRNLNELKDYYGGDYSKIKKITIFFYPVNFLFTDYENLNSDTHMIIEHFDEDLIYVSSLNCGYLGTGPRATQSFLQEIGFEKELTEVMIRERGIQIIFQEPKNIKTSKITYHSFFDDCCTWEERYVKKRKRKFSLVDGKIYIGDNIKFDLEERKVYLLNPQINNLTVLFILMDFAEVKEMNYFVGKQSPLDGGLRGVEIFGRFRRYADSMMLPTGVNVELKGDKFDILCFIDNQDQLDVISLIYYQLFNENFCEVQRIEMMDLISDNWCKYKYLFRCIKKLLFKQDSVIKGGRKIE